MKPETGIFQSLNINKMVFNNSEDILLQEKADRITGFSTGFNKKNIDAINQSYKKLFQNVIHDLKNPIGNILGVVYLLEADLQRKEDEDLLKIIKNSCENALSILDNLLTNEKQEYLNLENISANSLIEECLKDATGSLALKNMNVHHQALQNDVFILIDKQLMKRAFQNLIANAIKFSLQGGTICISSAISRNRLRISIADQGIGIPKNQQKYIFEKFTNAQRPGTSGETANGLGLYFTRESILKHKGRIWFESVENKGTTFHVEFDLEHITGI